MTKLLSLTIILGLCTIAQAQDKPKSEKKQIETFIDAAKAGPDFAIQGEYFGESPIGNVGCQVIADGDGQFTIRLLRGGLPGGGWNAKQDRIFKGKLENGKVDFSDEKGTQFISDGKITVVVKDKAFYMTKLTRKSTSEGMKPPEGAIVLFDGKNLDQWTKMDEKSPASWIVEGGYTQVKGGDIVSKAKFAGPHTIHVEFFLPFMPRARGQGRANSGVYIQNRYEVQVLDSFGLKGLNNEAGAIYSQVAPKVNMCYPPLQWQTYDIDFTPAKFADGKKTANARVTVKHNGVAVLEDVEIKGPTGGGKPEAETGEGIRLQDHGNPMRFRNIWVVEKK